MFYLFKYIFVMFVFWTEELIKFIDKLIGPEYVEWRNKVLGIDIHKLFDSQKLRNMIRI